MFVGMLIRTTFNNAGWAGKCTNAKRDARLFKCQLNVVDIGHGEFTTDERGICTSGCDEEMLCVDFRWPGHQGRVNKKKAQGTAFFVFPNVNSSLTLWGRATIAGTEGNSVCLLPFSPLPQDEWIWDLRAQEILGKQWGQGTYRFIDSGIQSRLERVIALKAGNGICSQ